MAFHFLWAISFAGLVAIGDPSVTKVAHLLLDIDKRLVIENFIIPIFKFQYFMAGVSASLLFYFALVFPNNVKPKSYVFIGVLVLDIALFILIFFTPIIRDVEYLGEIKGWGQTFDSLFIIFDVFVLDFFLFAIYALFSKRKGLEAKDKTIFNTIFLTIFLGIFPVSLGGIIIPQFGIYAFYLMWPIASVFFLTLLSYSVLKSRQMSANSVLIKTLIGTAVFVLVANLFVSKVSGVAIKTIIFASFIAVARLLLSNISKESERKKQIEKLNNELDVLHTTLAEKVIERTKELAEAEAHSETLLESLTVGIVEYDENFKVLRLNQAAEALLGTERKDVLGKTIRPADMSDRNLESISTILYPGISAEGVQIAATEEFEEGISKNSVVLKNPTRREVQIITVPIKGLGAEEILRYVKILRDVTHENIVNRSKSEFIKIAAHQLRTPLTGVKWALRSIQDKDFGEISGGEDTLVEDMYDANGSLINIVNDLLTVDRIEGNFGYKKTKNNIAEIIQESIRSSLILERDKNLSLEFKNNAPELPLFSFDPVKITIALKNMIGNAIDYTPSLGKIVVSLSEHDKEAVITITDTGIGINSSDMGSLFNKFYRSKEASELIPNRSGLGLYITKEIVEKHGGTLTVERGKESGTLVTMRLPMVYGKLVYSV